MTRKKEKIHIARELRRITGLKLPQAHILRRIYERGYAHDIVEILEKFGVKLIGTTPGIYCYQHPNEEWDTLIYEFRGKKFQLNGSCTGLSWPETVKEQAE